MVKSADGLKLYVSGLGRGKDLLQDFSSGVFFLYEYLDMSEILLKEP